MAVEYKLFILGKGGCESEAMIDALNKIGADGWIMVGGTLQEHDYEVGWTAIFYRQSLTVQYGFGVGIATTHA